MSTLTATNSATRSTLRQWCNHWLRGHSSPCTQLAVELRLTQQDDQPTTVLLTECGALPIEGGGRVVGRLTVCGEKGKSLPRELWFKVIQGPHFAVMLILDIEEAASDPDIKDLLSA